MNKNPLVAIIMGSKSDMPIASKIMKILEKYKVPYEVKVLSAHRNPKELEEYIKASDADVFIGIAGLSAHLPGYIASRTKKPVIGVPVDVKLGGLDALLSIVQMPKGVPVATVGIDNGENAAYLAIRILSLYKEEIKNNLKEESINKWTYTKAGVDINRISLLHSYVHHTIKRISRDVGIDIHGLDNRFTTYIEYNGLNIALHVDGVGTKVLISQLADSYWQVGWDAVAMNVNDLIAGGADPIALVDYITMEEPNEKIFKDIIDGFARACIESKTVLIGGETAIMPDIIKGVSKGRGLDIAAAGLGIVKWNVEPGDIGDVIIGFISNGIHSNGFSLVRKVLLNKYRMDDKLPYNNRITLAQELLKPTYIYVNLCRELWNKGVIKNLANITGGGFRKIRRVLKNGLGAVLNVPDPPEIFKLIRDEGKIDWDEMYRTFNMGIGMVAITLKDYVDEVIDISKKYGLMTYILGEITEESVIKINIPRVGEVLI